MWNVSIIKSMGSAEKNTIGTDVLSMHASLDIVYYMPDLSSDFLFHTCGP